MHIGEEYLLSGTYKSDDDTLHVSFCGQVRDEGYEGVSEWHDVSSRLKNNLESFHC
ncbi:unnamed protein product [Heligmosomoides polygyrus]|uniref:NTR domain-containing protein n=1 Tax=Heligmosomoides polygyrus TaxID=6339 RepID=A0A183G9S5_HELPZ|nr:unnamed protein product [Heligmosomoides polygyrus]